MRTARRVSSSRTVGVYRAGSGSCANFFLSSPWGSECGSMAECPGPWELELRPSPSDTKSCVAEINTKKYEPLDGVQSLTGPIILQHARSRAICNQNPSLSGLHERPSFLTLVQKVLYPERHCQIDRLGLHSSPLWSCTA